MAGDYSATSYDWDLTNYNPQSDTYNYNDSFFFTNLTEDEENGNNTVILFADSYSLPEIIISSIILTFMMIVVVVGNLLVIIAIATEKTLKNIQNWFIASLAVADFFVGLLIMPFSLANSLMGYWIFGSIWCSIHSAMDVLLCTSSIMNICLISLDRYWSITQAVDYLKKRTPGRAAIMITLVWALSALISIPPLLGWRDPDAQMNKARPECELSKDIGYVLYSALGSFYIPSCIMVFVYIQIFFAARRRARRGVRMKVQRPKPSSQTQSKTPTPLPPSSKKGIEAACGGGSMNRLGGSGCPSVSGGSSPRLPPLSAPPYLVTAPVELSTAPTTKATSPGGGESEGSALLLHATTITATTRFSHSPTRAVKFQEPLVVGQSEIIVRPEIMVESPEDSSAEIDRDVGPSIEHTCTQVDILSEPRREKTEAGDEVCESEVEDEALEEEDSKNPPPYEEVHTEEHEEPSPAVDPEPQQPPPRGPKPKKVELTVSDLENKIIELRSNGSNNFRSEPSSATHPPPNPSKKSKRPKLHFLRVEKSAPSKSTIWRTSSSLSINGDVHILGNLSQSCSRLQLDLDPVSDIEPSSSDSGAVSRCAVVKPLKFRLCQPFFGKKSPSAPSSAKKRRDVLDTGKLPSPKQEIRDPEREKRRIARKKEKRATLILGLIMGSFILCWLPFFILYILDPICPRCVKPWGFSIAFWLGYMNSALNPVIYTIFNKDFRRAFRRILFK